MIQFLFVAMMLSLFTFNESFRFYSSNQRRLSLLKMSDPAVDPSVDPALEAIRAKYKANPNYNALTDPEAQPFLDSLIPNEFRDFNNAIERVRVAIKDAYEGPDKVNDAEKVFSSLDLNNLISSPNSKFFKNNRPQPSPAHSEARASEALKNLIAKYPDLPRN